MVLASAEGGCGASCHGSQVWAAVPFGRIAEQCGCRPGAAAGGLAQMLPQIINQLTPDGQVPGNHGALLEQAMAALAARRNLAKRSGAAARLK